MGHVADNFAQASIMGKLTGQAAIGHVRYSTTGENSLRNVQPLYGDLHFGGFALGGVGLGRLGLFRLGLLFPEHARVP